MQDLNSSLLSLSLSAENKSKDIALLTKKTDDSVKNLHELKKHLIHTEKDLSSILDLIQKKNIVLSNAINPKEYQSVEKEIALLDNKKNDLELTILDTMEKSEKNEQAHVLLTKEHTKNIELLSKEIQDIHNQIALLQQELCDYTKKRVHLIPTIPEEWSKDYEKAKERMPNAIVTISRNMCSGCFHTMTESELSLIKRKRVIRCPECYRFLIQESEWKNN